MKRIVSVLLFVFSLLAGNQIVLLPDDAGFTISGEISFKKNYDIIVEIITREEYLKNLTSEYSVTIIIDEELIRQKKAVFSVAGVPGGYYIVKVYQDLNGNGKFDFALVGGEPLGTYKKPGFTLGRPSFKSLAFQLTKDLEGIKISL